MLIQNCEFIDVNCQNCKIQTHYSEKKSIFVRSSRKCLFYSELWDINLEFRIKFWSFILQFWIMKRKVWIVRKKKSELLLFIYSVVDTGFHKYNIYQQEAIMLTSLFLTP